MGRASFAVALCMAVASGSFIVALNHATVANVLFMQAVAPVLAALLAWTALGESVSRRTATAMGIALLGVALMVGGAGSGGVIGVGRLVRDDARLRRGDRDHAAQARGLDGPCDLPLAAARLPRVRAPGRSGDA